MNGKDKLTAAIEALYLVPFDSANKIFTGDLNFLQSVPMPVDAEGRKCLPIPSFHLFSAMCRGNVVTESPAGILYWFCVRWSMLTLAIKNQWSLVEIQTLMDGVLGRDTGTGFYDALWCRTRASKMTRTPTEDIKYVFIQFPPIEDSEKISAALQPSAAPDMPPPGKKRGRKPKKR
ncbi:MAG: hypothetical protein ACRCWR_04105 [Saezia sp.]